MSERQTPSPMTTWHGYALVNGLKMYYKIVGSGQPLILLHGGFGATEMFGDILPTLSKGRQVVATDLQGHGRTAGIDRPMRYESMADDVAALIRHLRLGKADVMGYSLGGGVALRTAIQHPEVVRKLVLVSAPFKRAGWYPGVLAAMGQSSPQAIEQLKETPMYKLYARIAPKPEDFPVLMAKLGKMLRQDYDWSGEASKIKAPTMIVVGDADSVRTAHAVEFFELLGGGKRDGGWDGSGMSGARLSILPGITHYDILSSPALASAVKPFLDGALP
jgi:pimeloyl-ACP methyl ester carboxylesterase